LITAVLLLGFNLAFQARITGINPARYLGRIAGVALNCLAMVAVLAFVASGDAQCHMSPWLDLTLRALAGASSYALGLAMLHPVRVSEFIAMLKGAATPTP
jgi:hypothetical protein